MNSVCAAQTSLVHFSMHDHACFSHTFRVFHWHALWLGIYMSNTYVLNQIHACVLTGEHTIYRLEPVIMLTVLHF